MIQNPSLLILTKAVALFQSVIKWNGNEMMGNEMGKFLWHKKN